MGSSRESRMRAAAGSCACGQHLIAVCGGSGKELHTLCMGSSGG